MKIYKYWVKVDGELKISGQTAPAVFYGKSNHSVDDAKSDAQKQRQAVQQRIDGKPQPPESYDVPIREEVTQQLSQRSLVTRNRYGALVLNTEELIFLDIDAPKFGFLERLFHPPKGTVKDQILQMVERKAAKGAFQHLGFRLYETRAGVRVIVQGVNPIPVNKDIRRLMAAFNVDPLYAVLCEKQQCYRARLTPKPSRIKCHAPKVNYPRSDSETMRLEKWIDNYNAKSEGVAVCRHIKDIGAFRENSTIRYHDDMTKAKSQHPLA